MNLLTRRDALRLTAALAWTPLARAAEEGQGFEFIAVNDLHYSSEPCAPFFRNVVARMKESVAPAVLAPSVHMLAENVIALIVQPKLSKKDEAATGKTLCKDYQHDSTTTVADPDINPKSQLPPVVQVTLVAIDEASATRIANGATPPGFDKSLDSLFNDTSKFDADLKTLQTTLAGNKPPVSFRVFTSNVSIRGAKWSRK